MGAEFLVAILWGVVVVYWAWSRRPAFGDSVGLFRDELHALANAAPVRVPPANRRRPLPYTVSGARYPLGEPFGDPAPSPAATAPGTLASLPAALAAAALSAQRLKARRRRRDVLCVLLAVVVVSALASLARRSVLTLSLQAFSDLALAAYAYLLVTRTRATMARSAAPRVQVSALDEPVGGSAVRPAPLEDWLVDLVDLDRTAAGHTPAHAMEGTPRATSSRRRPSVARLVSHDGERRTETYGDFDSYASLALAEAN
jgi:hypothetical protein